jgi:hypothetical protein
VQKLKCLLEFGSLHLDLESSHLICFLEQAMTFCVSCSALENLGLLGLEMKPLQFLGVFLSKVACIEIVWTMVLNWLTSHTSKR